MQKSIMQYVKKNGKIIGVLMGTKMANGNVIVTASKVALNKGDTFNKAFGIELCEARAYKYEYDARLPIIPKSMHPEAIKFAERCRKYFKKSEISHYTDF